MLFGTSFANLERKESDKRILWESNTIETGNSLIMQNDGNLILFGFQNEVIFQTYTASSKGEYFTIENDGNMVVYDFNNKIIWELKKSQGKLIK